MSDAARRQRQEALSRRLYTTAALNLLADAIASVALPLAFLQATGSISLSAALVTAGHLPRLVLSLPLSAVADRLPRAPVVIASYTAEFACLAGLALMLHQGVESLVLVSLIGVVRGTMSELGVSASAGYVPQVLGRENLLRYHSRIETIEGGVAIAGPSVGGWLVGVLGGVVSLAVPAVMSAFNAVVYYLLPRVPSPARDRGTRAVWRGLLPDIGAGLRFVVADRTQATVLAVNLALGASTASYVFGVVVHLREGLGLSPSVVGLVMAASGAGGLACSLVLDRLISVRQGLAVLLIAIGLAGLLLASFGLVPHAWMAAVWLFLLDVAWVACFIVAGTLQQYATPDDLLARVDAVNGLVFTAGAAGASAMAAAWLPSTGAPTFLLGVGASALIPIAVAAVARLRTA
ncbi:MFS transporter [Actinomyces bowdenii]|uniref:MFS transporter n=1 Tax=Actinomyces bowdenii TaxID=131109 RepID=A0A853EJ97_9ACTO|nr:MFS transporter [Actinomyces bowdenii]MBF0697166.1 MFS transporter [Actinomyces bowdenii]NYS69339.1 MFS transporter [Actinomyces bowdenii]